MDADKARALEFCISSPDAVVLTLWPSGYDMCQEQAREYLSECGAKITYETDVTILEHAALHVVRAMYHGEEWLESNCWYEEQPLESGRPDGPHAGAKWKKELCFRTLNSDSVYALRVFVVDAKDARNTLWSSKYSTRSRMATTSGNPGNSCMHLTDDQAGVVLRKDAHVPATGMGCDDSFAYQCARCLLSEESLHFLNKSCADPEVPESGAMWAAYNKWLSKGGQFPRVV